MVKVNDSLYLVKTIGSNRQFCLQKSLPRSKHFEIVLRAMPHQQFGTTDSRLKGGNLLLGKSKTPPRRLPLHQSIIHLRSGIKQTLAEGKQSFFLSGFRYFQISDILSTIETANLQLKATTDRD